MKRHPMVGAVFLSLLAFTVSIRAQEQATSSVPVAAASAPVDAKAKADAGLDQRAADWVAALNLEDPAKEARVKQLIVTHLAAIRDWNNEHPSSTVPAGINPVTGKRLSDLDRQVIASSAMPKSVHETLMTGLRKELSAEQVEVILDKYTVGKVAFTMTGYRAIVPDLTPAEAATILGLLKQAREEAIDYKSMKQISAIFKIYKTQAEQFLNSNGRNWKQLYKDYVATIKARKAGTNQPVTLPEE